MSHLSGIRPRKTVYLQYRNTLNLHHANKLFSDGSNVAYFRGRKLQGKAIPLPQEYKGVLLAREEKPENQATPAPQSSTGVVTIEDDDDDDDVVAEKMLTVGKFDELVVWGHEVVADAADDQYVRSIEEWLQVADQVCCFTGGWFLIGITRS